MFGTMAGYERFFEILPTSEQSPIDLIDSIVYPRKYAPLILSGHWLNDGKAYLKNIGTTAQLTLTGDRIPSMISGGPLKLDEYEFSQAHFHWGEENCRGAEHTINGTWFSMEAHVVHWNRKYVTFDESLKHRDGLCVLAYLFLVQPSNSQQTSPQLERITDNLRYIVNSGAETQIPANSLSWMRCAVDSPKYYTYSGSYNKIGEEGCATWIVFPVITPIMPYQLNQFRLLKDDRGKFIKSNWRETQLLKCRKIYLGIP